MLYGTHYLFCDKPNGNYMNYRYVYKGCIKMINGNYGLMLFILTKKHGYLLIQ